MAEQRMEIYRPVHKAVRHRLYSTAHQLGMADFGDEQVARETLSSLDNAISMLKEHAEHEERFIHPQLESRVPGVTASFGQNHQEDEQVYAQLEKLAAQTLREPLNNSAQAWMGRVVPFFGDVQASL